MRKRGHRTWNTHGGRAHWTGGTKKTTNKNREGGFSRLKTVTQGRITKKKKKNRKTEKKDQKKQRSSSRPGKPFFFSTRFVAQFIRHSSFPLHYNSLPTVAVNYNSVVHVASARLLLGRFTVAWAVTGQPKNKEKKTENSWDWVRLGPGPAGPIYFEPSVFLAKKAKNTLIPTPLFYSFLFWYLAKRGPLWYQNIPK